MEYAIPAYYSYLRLRSNQKEEMKSYLQYWLGFELLVMNRVCVYVVDLVLFFLEPAFRHLWCSPLRSIRSVGNMDIVKLPFFVWFSSPSLQGYMCVYKVLFENGLIRYSQMVKDYYHQAMERIEKWIDSMKGRIQAEKKE